MKTEIKSYETVCDSCSTVLTDDGTRSNCGSFQEPYLKLGAIDLCYSCAGKILYRDVIKKVPEEKLAEWVKSLKKAEGPNPLGPDLEPISLDLARLDEQNKYSFKNNTPLETTGVSEMTEVNCLEDLTPNEANQDTQNNMFKVQPTTNIKFLGDL